MTDNFRSCAPPLAAAAWPLLHAACMGRKPTLLRLDLRHIWKPRQGVPSCNYPPSSKAVGNSEGSPPLRHQRADHDQRGTGESREARHLGKK